MNIELNNKERKLLNRLIGDIETERIYKATELPWIEVPWKYREELIRIDKEAKEAKRIAREKIYLLARERIANEPEHKIRRWLDENIIKRIRKEQTDKHVRQ